MTTPRNEAAERKIQTPACDHCTQGIMDTGNDHMWGRCRCACHVTAEQQLRNIWRGKWPKERPLPTMDSLLDAALETARAEGAADAARLRDWIAEHRAECPILREQTREALAAILHDTEAPEGGEHG